ncbi:ABC transporter substrate-binding protein [Moraxella sp. ZJ142]|uniref:ABC transporter substrate-binding protein n=1 Tax=Moraxella marmotae TaxID=3344520 RepID=UPI0035D4EFD3
MNLARNKFALVMPAMLAMMAVGCSQPAQNTTSEQNSGETATKPAKTIAISAIVEHPSLDDIRLGVVDGLASLGYKQGENLTVNFQSAQGSMATAAQIAKQFTADNPDAIVAITTPTAQSLAAATETISIPLIYTAVSDPVAAKLIDQNNKGTQSNITGLSSQLPLEPQIELFTKIKPDAKRIGFVYSPGEANSVAIKNQLTELLPKYGMTLVDVPANRSSDVADATRSLAGKADLLYTSLDNGVASAMEAMVQAANELKIPVITSDEFSVRRGATAALGVNDYDFGLATAKLVAQALDGTPPSQITPEVMNTLTLFVSPKHAAEQGVTVDLATLGTAINVDTVPARQAQK